MGKQVILTGLRANNDLHLGNYLGALLPMVDMANSKADEFQINLFVPDLHSFTTPIDHELLQAQIAQNIRTYVAAGLNIDHPDVHIYRQSYIPAHSELTWILDCFTDIGEMNRMTQFKDKSGRRNATEIAMIAISQLRKELGENYWSDQDIEKKINERVDELNETGKQTASLGLFNYPVLMAADILLYGATYVPVGDDQTQHLEFTRDIAERMNSRFGDLFTVPKPVREQHEFFGKDQGLRIRDLIDPTKKMSKSDETGRGVIFLSDNADEARKKIMSATTDSLSKVQYDYQKQPGVSNLLDIYALLGGSRNEFIGQEQYGALKQAVADKVATFLTDFQGKLTHVDQTKLDAKLAESEKKMRQRADETLLKVQKAVGLRPS